MGVSCWKNRLVRLAMSEVYFLGPSIKKYRTYAVVWTCKITDRTFGAFKKIRVLFARASSRRRDMEWTALQV